MMGPLLAAAALASTTSVGPGPETGPRADMEALGSALEHAVQKVARPGAWAALQGGTWRAYRLEGYGAMFVLSPRVLPMRLRSVRAPQEVQLSRAIAEAMRGLEQSLKQADSEALRRQMEAALESLRQTQARLAESERDAHDTVRIREVERIHERELRRQMDNMQRQLEAFRREAERAREEAEREVAARLAIAPMAVPAPEVGAVPQPPAVAPPAQPAVPSEVAPSLPVAPPAPMAPPAVAPAPPAPPWEALWLDREEPAAGGSERQAQEVRAAVTATLQERGADLRGLAPAEFVVVAVDFMSRAAGASSRPQRTLLVRVRKRALDDVRAGRLSEAEFRKRVEYREY
jgi:hypothetical protein